MSFDPALHGWEREPERSNFARHIGPFWRRPGPQGLEFGLLLAPQHANNYGIAHGGVSMSFADHFLGILCVEGWQQSCVTLELSHQFVGAGQVGDFLIGRGEVVRRSRTIAFVRGEIRAADRVVLTSSGIWKAVRETPS
jgi:uncharacterized protein (TIGR00369 family)